MQDQEGAHQVLHIVFIRDRDRGSLVTPIQKLLGEEVKASAEGAHQFHGISFAPSNLPALLGFRLDDVRDSAAERLIQDRVLGNVRAFDTLKQGATEKSCIRVPRCGGLGQDSRYPTDQSDSLKRRAVKWCDSRGRLAEY